MKLLVCFAFVILAFAKGEEDKEKRGLLDFGIGYNFHLGAPHVNVGHHVPDAYAASGHHPEAQHYHHHKENDVGIHAQGFAGIHIGAPAVTKHVHYKPVPVVRVAHHPVKKVEVKVPIFTPTYEVAKAAPQIEIAPKAQVATPVYYQPQIQAPIAKAAPVLPPITAPVPAAPALQSYVFPEPNTATAYAYPVDKAAAAAPQAISSSSFVSGHGQGQGQEEYSYDLQGLDLGGYSYGAGSSDQEYHY